VDGTLSEIRRRRYKHYEEISLTLPVREWGQGLRLKLDLFVDRYFEYGRHGVVHVQGFVPDVGFLVVRSLATGETFHVVPVMLQGRRSFTNEMEVVAWMAV
jgi:hypothetical protein